jgi:Family of unknown function (DUF6496)
MADHDGQSFHQANAELIMARKYSRSASKDVEGAMRKRKKGTLRSGRSGRKVKSRKQAIAIGLSEARQKGKKVPKKKTGRKKTGGRKKKSR